MTTIVTMPAPWTAQDYAAAARLCYRNAAAHLWLARRPVRQREYARDVAEWAQAASDRAHQAARLGYEYLG